MKELVVILMSAMLALGNTACTSPTASTPAAPTEQTSTETDDNASAVPAETDTQGEKTLVVYYSASGNTERVAEEIAEATGGDLFALTPVTPYTSEDLDWTEDGSRVNREHEDETLRDIPLETTEVADWSEYDTVFIGYPIWWGIAAWPVNNFVEDNDFTGKTVIPFATSASSGMGESGALLAELAGSGDWQEGQRFSGSASAETVQDWVDSLETAD